MTLAILNPAHQAFVDSYFEQHNVDIAPTLLDSSLNDEFDQLLPTLINDGIDGEQVIAAINAVCDLQARQLAPAYTKWLKAHALDDADGYDCQLGRLVALSLGCIFEAPEDEGGDPKDEVSTCCLADRWLYDICQLNPNTEIKATFGYFEERPGECLRAKQAAIRERFRQRGFAENQLDYIEAVSLGNRAVSTEESAEAREKRFHVAVAALPKAKWPAKEDISASA